MKIYDKKILEKNNQKKPWHLWIVIITFAFLYAVGVYDYFMVVTNNQAYYLANNYTKEVISYFSNYPTLPFIFWTINIFSGLITVFLLMFRSERSALMALIAGVSMLILDFITFGFMNRWNILGTRLCITDIIIMLLTFGLFFYCKLMIKKNVLC